jgi:hypothetical protein
MYERLNGVCRLELFPWMRYWPVTGYIYANRSLGKLSRRWDVIKLVLRETEIGREGVDWPHMAYDESLGGLERGNDSSGSIQGGEFVWPNDSHPLRRIMHHEVG